MKKKGRVIHQALDPTKTQGSNLRTEPAIRNKKVKMTKHINIAQCTESRSSFVTKQWRKRFDVINESEQLNNTSFKCNCFSFKCNYQVKCIVHICMTKYKSREISFCRKRNKTT